MATNRDLLKEAIADAKAVKETAIANAKAALEEAFTPQLKTMFAAKLQEIEEGDDLKEMYGKSEDEKMKMEEADDMKMEEADEVYESEDDMTNEIDLEELLRELELEEGEAEGLYEAEEEEEESEEEEEESEEGEDEGEPLDLEDMTDEDLKSMIEDVIKDMINSGELEAGHEGEGEEESEEGEEEEVDLAELLREIEEMEKMQEPVDEGFIDTIKKGVQNIFKGGEQKWLEKEIASGKYNNILKAIEAAEGEDAKRAAAKPIRDDFMAHMKATSREDVPNSYFQERLKELDRVLGYGPGFKSSFSAAQRATTGVDEAMKAELEEALKTINALKSELNEINLLNAKLLYTNKIFKSKNLNENQKVKVLSSFDKAKTVGEVKMVFETLNEGIKVSKNTIKENLGSASKAMVTPNAKKPIVESNDAFLRMQKLAGLL
jgi:hypothetical protein